MRVVTGVTAVTAIFLHTTRGYWWWAICVKTGVSLNVTITTITMRDITNSPIFLRLGSRMRGPEGVPIGALRRVIISNIACSNSASTLGSIISGIQFSNIEIACVKEDLRPAFVLQEVKGAEFFRVRATHAR